MILLPAANENRLAMNTSEKKVAQQTTKIVTKHTNYLF